MKYENVRSNRGEVTVSTAEANAKNDGTRWVEAPWLGPQVTPGPAAKLPRHWWFRLAHGFSPLLITFCLERFGRPTGPLLDPFCGSGTTLLAGSALGVASYGLDLSPLSVLAASVKVAQHNPEELLEAARAIREALKIEPTPNPLVGDLYSPEVRRAIEAILTVAEAERWSLPTRGAIRLATITHARQYASKVRSGGWLQHRTTELPVDADLLLIGQAARTLTEMAHDVRSLSLDEQVPAVVLQGDARALPLPDASMGAVLTSPPYPNRHDYSRAYGVELATGLASAEEILALRRQQIHSHPEARPWPPQAYEQRFLLPPVVETVAAAAKERGDKSTAKFIPEIARGWALDMGGCLLETYRVLRPGGWAVYVVGNAAYVGTSYPSDAILANLAQQVGFQVKEILVARRRLASAQQLRRGQRIESRESLVVLQKA